MTKKGTVLASRHCDIDGSVSFLLCTEVTATDMGVQVHCASGICNQCNIVRTDISMLVYGIPHDVASSLYFLKKKMFESFDCVDRFAT